jgi:hypothetical protein
VANGGGRVGWLVPHFGTIFFVLQIAVWLLRATEVLKDPGVGWHLRAGQLMLDTHALPGDDPFSFTATAHPWIDYYWLWELASAALDRLGGLPLFATVWMLAYACIPLVLYRNTVRAGASPLAALLLLPLASTILLSHALTRPHVVTYLFFAIVVGVLDDVDAGRRDVRRLWWLPLLAIVWASSHGGYIAGLAAVGIVAAAHALHAFADGDAASRRRAVGLAVLFLAMAVATLANPYGITLHRQTLEHLGQPSTGRFAEFRSPDFRAGGVAVGAFEALIAGLLVLTGTGYLRPTIASFGLVLGTLHMALTSVRNINLFVLVATPLVATGLTRILAERFPRVHARWQAIGVEQERSAGWPLHVVAVAILCVGLAIGGRLPFPSSLDGLQISRGAAAHIRTHPERFARPFNTDAMGGVLIYNFWPRVHVFVDDRTPVYGERFMQDYFAVLDGKPDWSAVLERWHPTAAIVPTSAAVASLLRGSPAWRIDYADEQTALFVPRDGRDSGP